MSRGSRRSQATTENLRRVGTLHVALRLAGEYRVELHDLLGDSRTRSSAAARRHLWTLMRDTLDMSYPEIASVFGVDHTSVLVAVRKRHSEIEASYRAAAE